MWISSSNETMIYVTFERVLFVELAFQSYEIVHNVLIFLFLYIIGVMSLIISIETVKIGLMELVLRGRRARKIVWEWMTSRCVKVKDVWHFSAKWKAQNFHRCSMTKYRLYMIKLQVKVWALHSDLKNMRLFTCVSLVS